MMFNPDGTAQQLSYEEYVALTDDLDKAYQEAVEIGKQIRDRSCPEYRNAWRTFFELKRQASEARKAFYYNNKM